MWSNSDTVEFFALLREKAKEIAPEYPNLDTTNPYELLWAITESYRGISMANDDLHKFAACLIEKMGITYKEAVNLYREQNEGIHKKKT